MGDVLVGATIIFLGLINPDSDYFDKADALAVAQRYHRVLGHSSVTVYVSQTCHVCVEHGFQIVTPESETLYSQHEFVQQCPIER